VDPTLEKLLTGGGFAFLGGVLGGLVAPVIAGLFGRGTAQRTAAAQRELEREKARRDWRRAQIGPLLEAAAGRALAYRDAGLAATAGDPAHTLHELSQVHFGHSLYRYAHLAMVDDDRLNAPVQAFIDADDECYDTLKAWAEGLPVAESVAPDQRRENAQRLAEATAPVGIAANGLIHAAERYIFEDPALPQRPWWRFWT
jgi:hypothetical protein